MGNGSDMSSRSDLIGEENKYSYPESDMAKPRLEKVYIQASLHADELPGIVVINHLMKLLEEADHKGLIRKQIVIVPYANPLGLSQKLMGAHIGRFSLSSGVNFNRNFLDITDKVAKRVDGLLDPVSEEYNVRLIRRLIQEELQQTASSSCGEIKKTVTAEEAMKRILLMEACDADVVLDLHCDTDAVMHMYTHDKLWPALSDLAIALGSECNILDSDSGGNCFDEACSFPWAKLSEKFPNFPIPMACQSTTVELRGEHDVSDDLARRDAIGLYRFLQHRGYILKEDHDSSESLLSGLPAVSPVPLTGVDMIEADAPGVICWKVKRGDVVNAGALLGEIINVEDVFAPRTEIRSRTSGLVFGMRTQRLAVPGDIVIKVAGKESLAWRTGNLLTN